MISVAIAAYCGEEYIIKLLNSIKNQKLSVDEVVISDDCSTDTTVALCEKFFKQNNLTNWRIIKNEKNLGYCFNFYNAINECKGDIIFLADQDDEWYENKTAEMVKALNENQDIYVLASRYDVIDKNSKIIENSGVTYLGNIFDGSIQYLDADSFIGCSYIRGFSMCFKKEIKDLLKPIDLKNLLSHDWYICMLGNVLGKTAVLNTKLGGYRYHFDNVSLSDMTRKSLIGDRQKRLNGLRESIEGHTYIASLQNGVLKTDILNFVNFEKIRLKFLQSKNLFTFLRLLFFTKQYSRYYKGGGFRVWLGDFAYAYNINFNFRI